ncbi:MAG TPA: hypothetical protein VGH62_05610 [Bradyrhizobium sp.]|jgi:hypothetical protein
MEDDREIVNLAQQLLAQRRSTSDLPAAPAKVHPEVEVIEATGEARPDRIDVPKVKEVKTAAELAQMIEADLAKHPDCPKNGFRVTVYGTTLWRAMLTITPAAGPIRNPQEWRDFTEELAERIRKRYDLAWH